MTSRIPILAAVDRLNSYADRNLKTERPMPYTFTHSQRPTVDGKLLDGSTVDGPGVQLWLAGGAGESLVRLLNAAHVIADYSPGHPPVPVTEAGKAAERMKLET